MQFLVLFNVILCALCVAGRGWNSNDYTETCTDGYFTQWINYMKRFSLSVLLVSGVILYYIPESRSHARKGCCWLIDYFADGLKTILCLKESEITLHKKKSYYIDSFISQKHSQDFNENENHKDLEAIRQKEELIVNVINLRKKSKNKKEKSKSEIIHERSSSRTKHHRNEKLKSIKDIRESNKNIQHSVSPLTFEYIESEDEYLIDDGFTETSPIYSNGNCVSYLISGSPQQMAILDEKEGVNIVVPRKLLVKPKYVERKSYNETVGVKDLSKATCNVAKILSTTETVILNGSELKLTCEVNPPEKMKKIQLIKDSDNKEARIYYERTPQLKEKLNVEFKYKDQSGNVKESEKFLRPEETDEKEKKFTGAKLLSELGDQINKLDFTIRMMRPPSKNEITEKDEKISAETVLKDTKRVFQENDGVRRRKTRTSQTILSKKSDIEFDNKRKSKEGIRARFSEDKFIDQTIKKSINKSKVTIADENNFTKKELKKEKSDKTIGSKVNEDECDMSDNEEIPILTNRVKPIFSRAVDWLFGGCPRTQNIKSEIHENE